jgi:hypothetical protein
MWGTYTFEVEELRDLGEELRSSKTASTLAGEEASQLRARPSSYSASATA